ncbi:MAG: KEOPS complex subunit Cgi121 [Natronomonas sp.]
MELVEGAVEIGTERFPSVGAFVDALGDVADDNGVTVQAFDARYVVSRRHLERAVELADRERGRGDAIARERGVEILLYAAGRRQINRALELGVEAGETPVVVLVDSETGDDDAETVAAEAVAAFVDAAKTFGRYEERRVREFYDIGAEELAATDAGLEALVLERVALLVVER